MKSSAKNISLNSYDDIFSTEETREDAKREKVMDMPLSELHPFPGHPFQVRDDDSMKETVESIKEYGVLVPAIVRPRAEGGYELISGHRRKHACELAGLPTMPVIVRNLDDDAATIIMVDSNIQRENILPSERAKAYKMKLDAIKHQGERTDLTSILCVNNVFNYWHDGLDKKLTQLVFCDISTPKGRAATKEDRAVRAGGKFVGGTELHALQDATPEADAPEAFSVYSDIREKLIARGVPAGEIAFIHDADTEVKKKELFAKVRAGQVRVLMGSTAKMGAGMNVQDLLIASHDLDCPWRPGDLEQRSGRIIRQYNTNPEGHIFRYVTEGTFDSYLWQTVENKQKFISQIMTSKSPVRSCEDIDETALSYAEIKALCAGDERIKEKMDLDMDVAKLKLMKANHQSQQFRLEDNLLKYFPEEIERNKGFIKGLETDMTTLDAHPHPKDGFAGMVVRGDSLTDKDNAGAAILEACKEVKGLEPMEIGGYRGFTMSLSVEGFGQDFILTLKGQMSHRVTLGKDARGNLIRIDNALTDMPKRLQNVHAQLDNLHSQMAAAKAEIGKPFPQEAELAQKSARLAELNTLLDIDSRAPAQRQASEVLEKSERPSVLESLKKPCVHGLADKSHKKELEAR